MISMRDIVNIVINNIKKYNVDDGGLDIIKAMLKTAMEATEYSFSSRDYEEMLEDIVLGLEK